MMFMLGEPMTAEHLLQVENVSVQLGTSQILHDVHLTLDKRPRGVLGRNGMGKTTLCKTLMGLHPVSGGSIRFKGEDITRKSPEERALMGIGYIPQGRRLFRSLTVHEHLKMMERKGGNWTIDRVYDTFPRLKERRSNNGDSLSGGEGQMLAISRALLLNPDLMILDEPTEGLAPTIVADVITLVEQIARDGMAVLLVEQNLHAALSAVDQVSIMVNGEVAETMDADILAADTQTQKRYLGMEPGQAAEAHEEEVIA